jgi:hypothetical protein
MNWDKLMQQEIGEREEIFKKKKRLKPEFLQPIKVRGGDLDEQWDKVLEGRTKLRTKKTREKPEFLNTYKKPKKENMEKKKYMEERKNRFTPLKISNAGIYYTS